MSNNLEQVENNLHKYIENSLGAAYQIGPCPKGDMCCMRPYPKK